MVRTVLQKGSKILRTKCREVENFSSVRSVIDDLNETINYLKTTYAFARGIGLAAPQIGENICVAVLEFANKKRYELINPKIIGHSDLKEPIREGCISFFDYRAFVPRYKWVKVQAYDHEGRKYLLGGEGDEAMLLQHEIDHLDGILYVERLKNGERDLFLI